MAGRVALFGWFGAGNMGNDASLAVVAGALRDRYGADVVAVCERPDVVRAELGLAAVPLDLATSDRPAPTSRWARLLLRPWREAARAVRVARWLRSVDQVVVPGTGILDDFSVRWSQIPLDLLVWVAMARVTRTPFHFVAIGAGPIHDPATRRVMVSAVQLSTSVSYRDELSRRFLAEQGRNTRNDRVVPDVVFGLHLPHDASTGDQPPNGQPAPAEPRRRTVGVGLMAYRGWRGDDGPAAAVYRTYLAKISAFVTWLLDHGYDVRLLTGAANDQEAMDDVVGRVGALGADGRLQVSKADRLEDLCRDIAATDLVVATRYHNVVAALLVGRPVVSVGYAEKNRELLAHFGLDDACQHVETFDVERLQRQFTELAEHAVARRPSILAEVDQLSAALDEELDRRFGSRVAREAA